MKSKKILALILALCMSFATIAISGCSSNDDSSNKKPNVENNEDGEWTDNY